jgi:hypothetical protein
LFATAMNCLRFAVSCRSHTRLGHLMSAAETAWETVKVAF